MKITFLRTTAFTLTKLANELSYNNELVMPKTI